MDPSEIEFRGMVENTPEAVTVGVEGRYVWVNAAAVRLFGAASPQQLLGTRVLDHVHPDFRHTVAQRIRRLTDDKETCPAMEQVYLRMDGTPVDVEVFAVPLRVDGRDGAVAFVRDISARKAAESAIRSQAERHETLLATTGEGFWICDLQGRILEVNDAFSRMSGYTREELLSMRIPDIEAIEKPEETAEHIRKITETGYDRFETRHRRKNGEVYEVEILSSYWSSQNKLLVFHRDITMQKQAEAELARSRELLRNIHVSRALTDAMGNGVIGADAERRVLFANPRAQELLRMREDEMRGRKLDEVLGAATAGSDRPCACWDQLPEGKTFETEVCTFARGDGTRFPVNLVIAPLPEDASPTRAVLSFWDISVRKEAQQALLDADRRKNQFLAMLAHELRNPLTPIRNAAYVLGRLELNEPMVTWAQAAIESQVQHLSRLTDELLDVSRIVQGKVELKREPVEFRTLLDQVTGTARPMFASRHQHFGVRLPDGPAWIDGDPVRLTQVISNLMDNASKYTQPGGSIELEAQVRGQVIDIRVRDNGPGISADLLPHVFDLFQQGERTLDRSQGGLGIGLTLVRKLAFMHGGSVEAHSAGPGKGATFVVRLPLAAAPAATANTAREEPSAAGGRVLVVDDEPAVRDSLATLLEVVGYEVAVAASGQAALEQVQTFRPQVVLLDIGLTGMDGFETAQRLSELPYRGEMWVVALTGYADEATKQRALASGCDRHMGKPVDPKALLAFMSEFIGNRRRADTRPAELTP